MSMDINGLIDNLRTDLSRSADVGGADVKAAAERLLNALEPAVRLTLMDALSQAAAEVRGALPGVAIDVRLNGRDPVFVVDTARAAAPPPDANDSDDGENAARITLRLPEALKAKAETQAQKRGQSLNTWIVGAVRMASGGGQAFEQKNTGAGQRLKGWAK
jgi:hypothetical protein